MNFRITSLDIDTIEKWKFRMDEIEYMCNLICSVNDFFVYGVKGCGKTTLIRDLMKEIEIKYIRINCI